MRTANPLASYRNIATLTAPPGQIVLMLYDGAIHRLEKALPGFSHNDPAEANMIVHNNVQRAQDIIRELNYALNMEHGGECAATLRQLYDYFDRRLAESNMKKRSEGVKEVIRHLSELRTAWATMLAGPNSPDNTAASAALVAA